MFRRILIFALAVLFVSCAKTGENNKAKIENTAVAPKFDFKKESYANFADVMPELIGGLESIQKRIKYPEEAIKNKIEGTVYVMAYINENGGIDFVEVVKGIGYGCDEEAMKAVAQAKFTPAYSQGKPVKTRVVIPIRFKLR